MVTVTNNVQRHLEAPIEIALYCLCKKIEIEVYSWLGMFRNVKIISLNLSSKKLNWTNFESFSTLKNQV